MYRIAVTRNRFSNFAWSGIEWISYEEAELSQDFIVFVGKDIELAFHPDMLIRYRQREFCGVLYESESIHATQPDFPAPLGYPKFRDDFFTLRNSRYAEEFLKRWQGNDRNVTQTVWELGVPPCEYPPHVMKIHAPEIEIPAIVWGADVL